jgi:hypothetical protein
MRIAPIRAGREPAVPQERVVPRSRLRHTGAMIAGAHPEHFPSEQALAGWPAS